VDAIYMDAVQAMTGSGGWPMSVFLTPDGSPFYAGTYFPDIPRHGMPSFRQVLEGIAATWTERRDDVESQGAQVAAAINRTSMPVGVPAPVSGEAVGRAFEALASTFDATWGGFGGAPKFPQPMVLEWLLRQAVRKRPSAIDMAVVTLDRMANGGIHDQVGGGFARYSTDAMWHVPHFEKMLADNAQLLQLFTHAWLYTREARFGVVAKRTADYLVRELQQPTGGFSTSQDADSEGVEGKFFVWSWDELTSLVGEPVAEAFGVRQEGNWDGTNVLWRPVALGEIAGRHGLGEDALSAEVEQGRATLFAARAGRVPPATDDKVVTAWNGLAIRALAIAGRALDVPSFVDAALACGSFAWETLRDDGGRLLRSWRAGRTNVLGFLDDYALLGLGVLTLYETTGDVTWFIRARTLADEAIELFADRDASGFFMTGADAEALLVRPKEVSDNAVPSGNAAMAELLARLALYTGESGYELAATATVALVGDAAQRYPSGFGHALCVMDLLQGPAAEIAVVGDRDAPETEALVAEVVRARHLPNTVLAIGDPRNSEADTAVPLLRGRPAVSGQAAAYVCERFLCKAPVSHPEALAELLSG
jgi:uncharacterized protein YyaL (SSP411 family)